MSIGLATLSAEECHNLAHQWANLESILKPLLCSEVAIHPQELTLKLMQSQVNLASSCQQFRQCGILSTFETHVLELFTGYLDAKVLPEFVSSLESSAYSTGSVAYRRYQDEPDSKVTLETFFDAVCNLEKCLSCAFNTMSFIDSMPQCNMNLFAKATNMVRAYMMYHVSRLDSFSLKLVFIDYFEQYSNQCSKSGKSKRNQYAPKRSLRSSFGRFNKNNPEMTDLDRKFKAAFSFLFSLSLYEDMVKEPMKEFLDVTINKAVQNLCTTDFEHAETEFKSAKEYVDQKCLNFISDFLSFNESDSDQTTELNFWSQFCSDLLLKEVAFLRIEQIFAMIVEFPESQPAIDNLKFLLRISTQNLTNHLVSSVRSAFETRLLHPGANTSEILTQYINAIKVLQQLDSTCSILDRTCAPVVKYLRSREDTVRCIVCNMTEDAELAGELLKRCELQLAPDPYESDDEDIDWRTWQPKLRDYISPKQSSFPRPLGLQPETPIVQSHRNQDIMSILVNIYESKELFVNEYRSLLADRILNSAPEFDSDKELRHLELLSYKFGHDEINKCNVMLRDVAESKRTNEQLLQSWSQVDAEDSTMRSDENENAKMIRPDFPISATIISAQFWPALKEEKMELPQKLKRAFERYKLSYEGLKHTRTVEWISHLGKVEVEIETNDGSVRAFTVTPVQAAVLSVLESHPKVTFEDLSSMMGLSTSVIRRKIGGLFSLGVLTEKNGVIEVIEDCGGPQSEDQLTSKAGPSASSSISLFGTEDDDTDSARANEKDLKEEEMKCYWMYTVSMLRNLKSMSADNIHSMIKMFSKAGNSSELSQEALTAFLNKKVKEELLCYSNGVYKLPSKN